MSVVPLRPCICMITVIPRTEGTTLTWTGPAFLKQLPWKCYSYEHFVTRDRFPQLAEWICRWDFNLRIISNKYLNRKVVVLFVDNRIKLLISTSWLKTCTESSFTFLGAELFISGLKHFSYDCFVQNRYHKLDCL